MRVAYLVAEFPKLSETFVSREILTLRRLGLDVRPFAFQQPSSKDAKELDLFTRQLMGRVDYLTKGLLVRQALDSWEPLQQIWTENKHLQQLAILKSNAHLRLLRAVTLAQQLRAGGIRHLHAHWPYATQIAYLVHKLTGISFSISIHAHEVEHD